MIKKLFLIAAALILAVSCSKTPTDPNGGGSGGGTTPQPTPSSFIEELKTIGIVKAGDQQWDFKTIKEDATGKILTVEPMNGSKSGNLKGLKSYISSKLRNTFNDFKYYLSFNPDNSTASDGNGNPQNANSDALEIKITFIDKTTENPVTDPDFKDGFTLKIVANTKWAETPEITQADIEASLHKVGNINLGLNFDFSTLTLNQVQQGSYSYETTLTVDNNSGAKTDLIQFVETVLKADSQTSYLKISYFSANGDDTFDVEFQTVSGDKVFNSNSRIKLIIVGTNPQNPIFNLRDLNVSISGNPTLITDNSGNGIGDKITINTDAPYVGLQATKIEQLSGTTVNIPSQDIGNYVYGSYYPPENVSHVFIEGEAVTLIHNTLKDGETAQFKVTFVAFCEGYNPKEGLVLTINVTKGQSLPEISYTEFKSWLDSINIAGYDKEINVTSLTLRAQKAGTPYGVLKEIQEALYNSNKDKIIVEYDNIRWDSSTAPNPGNINTGKLKVRVKPAENTVFSQDLLSLLKQEYEYYYFEIDVVPQSTWLGTISINGKGADSSNPLDVNIGDGITAPPSVEYDIINLPENSTILSIYPTYFQTAEGIEDAWNLDVNIDFRYIFEYQSNYTPDMKPTLTIKPSEVLDIVNNSNIAKDSTQIYKLYVDVSYETKGAYTTYVSERIDLYVKLIKNVAGN